MHSPLSNHKSALLLLVSVLLSAALLGACAPVAEKTAQSAAGSAVYSEISVDQAAARQSAGALMLDVRQPDEWNEAHIEGATLIPLGELQNRLSEVPKDREIVVYCRSGNRSQTGAEILAKAGYSGVTSMAGGITDWQAAGYPTVSGP